MFGKFISTLLLLSVTVAAWAYISRNAGDTNSQRQTYTIAQGAMESWLVLRGDLQAHSTDSVAVNGDRRATLIDIVAEGTVVAAGDKLATFDTRELTKQLSRLEHEVELQQGALQELVSATHPLQLAEMTFAITEAQGQLDAKTEYLHGSESLARDNLLSMQELKRTRREKQQLQIKLDSLQLRLDLVTSRLHPAQLAAAQNKLSAAQRELQVVRKEINRAEIEASVAGVVWYSPLNINGEYRNVRVGDTLYPNQPFLLIPDLSTIVAKTLASEKEISKVRLGAYAVVQAVSSVNEPLSGRVANIGRVPQQKPGSASWQRYFPVTVKLDAAPADLMPGISSTIRIRTFATDSTTLLPRHLVKWQEQQPFVLRLDSVANEEIKTNLVLGKSNNTFFEVLDGLEAGDLVVIQ